MKVNSLWASLFVSCFSFVIKIVVLLTAWMASAWVLTNGTP